MTGLEVKRELTEKRIKSDEEKLALLSGFVRVTFSLYKKGGGIGLSLDCQTDFVRQYINSLMMERFKVTPLGKSEGVLSPEDGELVFGDGDKLLRALYIIKEGDVFELCGISDKIKARGAYARGVFLGCGSVSVPSASTAQNAKSGGYHIEFGFSSEELANDFIALLSSYNVYAHLTYRSGKYIVYVKDSSDISDCLALIGADRAVLDMNAAMATYAVKGDVNRRLNFEMANMSRTVAAAIGVTDAIAIIEKKIGLDALDKKLRAAALARKNNPHASIDVLAGELGISKSGLKHRFDRLVTMAGALSPRPKADREGK